jgi:hypothetical protein
VHVDKRMSALCSESLGSDKMVMTCLKCGHEFLLETKG